MNIFPPKIVGVCEPRPVIENEQMRTANCVFGPTATIGNKKQIEDHLNYGYSYTIYNKDWLSIRFLNGIIGNIEEVNYCLTSTGLNLPKSLRLHLLHWLNPCKMKGHLCKEWSLIARFIFLFCVGLSMKAFCQACFGHKFLPRHRYSWPGDMCYSSISYFMWSYKLLINCY